MNIIQSILTNNPCYKAGKKITVKGLMLHSVGCSQPSAMVFVNMWNKSSFGSACVHGFIDANTGDTYQTLPWNHRGWHGGGSSNDTHIGVEMCEPSCIKYTGGAKFTCSDLPTARRIATTTYNSAVELFAMLCKEFSLDPLKKGVIVSHAEGYRMGIASGHADPEHMWSGLGMSYTMDTFRQDVNARLTGSELPPAEVSPSTGSLYRVRLSWTDSKSQKGAYKVLKNAIECADKNAGYSVFDDNGTVVYATQVVTPSVPSENVPFVVKVEISNLNIRQHAGTKYNVVGLCPRGVYTITEVEDGFGKLKSGQGWICLDYVKIVTR